MVVSLGALRYYTKRTRLSGQLYSQVPVHAHMHNMQDMRHEHRHDKSLSGNAGKHCGKGGSGVVVYIERDVRREQALRDAFS